ncbi:MAG: hypothetical protein KKD56_07740 [Acidobacteria bacterium]|nr:hypothetical protein [Acidobacteriota bacterium]
MFLSYIKTAFLVLVIRLRPVEPYTYLLVRLGAENTSAALERLIAAWYIMSRWLQNYAYNTGLNPLIFIGAAAAALMIALLTISFQAFRAAAADPVDSLRYE